MKRQVSRMAAGAVTALSLLLLLAAGAQTPDPAKGVRILYPAPRSAHSSPVRLMIATEKSATTPAVKLDGKPVPMTKMTFAETWAIPSKLKRTAARVRDRAACVLWVAQITLAPGQHVVAAGDQKLPLLGVKNSSTPLAAGWTRASAHRLLPSGGHKQDCAACHELTDDALGSVATPNVCAPCHDETSVQLIHNHIPQPLAKCAMCHDPHGAALPKLLVDTKQKLCTKCHASGHFRGLGHLLNNGLKHGGLEGLVHDLTAGQLDHQHRHQFVFRVYPEMRGERSIPAKTSIGAVDACLH